MPVPRPDPRALALLPRASQRLVRTVDGLPDAAWVEASGLPDWSRAHVVAHLALNAEGLTGALTGMAGGEPAPMYRSGEARDEDIVDLAAAAPSHLRDRLLGAITRFDDALGAVPQDAWDTPLERTPGGRTFLAAEVADMRLREVEIHHADLAASYSWSDWGDEFALLLVEALLPRVDGTTALAVVASDLDRSWTIGNGGPTVTGPTAALGWWLTGRGDGAGLTSEGGRPPRIGAW